MLLLLFKQDGRTKYALDALEAFLLLVHDSALLSAQMATRQKHDYNYDYGLKSNYSDGPMGHNNTSSSNTVS